MSFQMFPQVAISDNDVADSMQDDPEFAAFVFIASARVCDAAQIGSEFHDHEDREMVRAFLQQLLAELEKVE